MRYAEVDAEENLLDVETDVDLMKLFCVTLAQSDLNKVYEKVLI